MTVITLSVASGLIVSVNSDRHHTMPSAGPSPAFPAATLAGRDFTPYAPGSTRGVTLSAGRLASAGDEVVAVGAETGQLVSRAQFFVSPDGGRSWALGTVTAAGGGPPAPGHAARFVAGGAGKWAAVGPDSIWTSADGRAWTLASATGLPQHAGDQVTVLKRTGNGFIAAGANMPGAGLATPVIFLSASGTSWTRLGAGRLRLAAGHGRALDIRLAAADGPLILIAGDVATSSTAVTGGSRHAVTVRTGGAWLSGDGGRSWTPVTVPAGPGTQDQFSDAAATADGFLLVRPATVDGVPAADVYRSGNGRAWTFAATLTTRAGFTPGLMNGSSAGAVLAGQSGGTLTAFTSPDGIRWRQGPAFGRADTNTVSGVAATRTGTVVAAGMGATDRTGAADGSQQLITVAGGADGSGVRADGSGVRNASRAAIPGAVQPQLAVDAVAAQGGRQVAVGSANGFPAAWLSADGGRTWQRAAGQTPAVLARPALEQLTSITHGRAGWLAVGGATGPVAGPPVVIGSADGRLWSAADGEPVFAGSGLVTEQAAAARGVYVIVGRQVMAPAGAVAAAWWSAGLTGWHRAGDAAAGALDGAGNRQMHAVTATADGFVAVGSHGRRPAAWTTSDGRTWTQADLPLPAGATDAVLQHVAAAGRTVVAAGLAGQVPFAARSADGGRTWTEARMPVPVGTAQVSALAAAGGGFTATGTFGAAPGDRDVVVWTSQDGTTWQAATPAGPGLAAPGIQAITGLAVSGRTLTGVGFSATPAGEQPILWQPLIR